MISRMCWGCHWGQGRNYSRLLMREERIWRSLNLESVVVVIDLSLGGGSGSVQSLELVQSVAVLVRQALGQFSGTLGLLQSDTGFIAGDGQLVGTGVGLDGGVTGSITSGGLLGDSSAELLVGSLEFSDGLLVVCDIMLP